MANSILVDTTVLIGLQLGDDQIISDFKKHRQNIYISRITACEFIFGSRNSREKKINKEFVERLDILELNPEISEYAYRIIDNHGLKVNIGIADALIAATAIIYDYPLWTLNTKDFKMMKELKLI